MAHHDAPDEPGLVARLLHPQMVEDPPPDQLADSHDDLDWNVDRDGRMREHATEDEPATEIWEG